MAYGDLNYTTEEINADLKKIHDKESVVEEAPSDGKQYGRKDGAWAEIEASTQYLDLSMFSEGSGTLSEEDYQKVVKAYEDGLNMLLVEFESMNLICVGNILYSGSIYIIVCPYSIGYSTNISTNNIQITLSNNRSYTRTECSITLFGSGSGKNALTDNGEYAEFAKPTKVESGGSGTVTKQLKPNTFYKFGSCSKLTITFAAEESGIENEYKFEFVSGTTATTLSLPDTVKWSGGNAPTIEASKTYQVSIVNNLAVFAAF